MFDIIFTALFVVILVLLFLIRKQFAAIKTNQDRPDEVDTLREEISRFERGIKEEIRSSQITISETLTTQLHSTAELLGTTLTELGKAQTRELENVTKSTNNLTQSNEERIENIRQMTDDRIQALQTSNENSLDQIRQTVTKQLTATADTLVSTVGEFGKAQTRELENVTKSTNNLTQSNEERIENIRQTADDRIQALQTSNENSLDQIRQTVTKQLTATADTLVSTVGEFGKAQKTITDTLVETIGKLGDTQKQRLEDVTKSTNNLVQSNEASIENIRKTVDTRLQTMQDSNERKLDEMRKTVDEQLQSTLEKRLTESFKMVSERLESVREGLGTMQELASDVGNLQRVLTNVSTRGAWGEVQLGAILEDTLTSNQYGKNVQPHAGSERVEYAIRLPGQNGDTTSHIWLPIDAKFPREDYERIREASERVDKDEEQKAIRGLIRTVSNEAKTIKLKYVAPPHTTDFAIMFLPTEGLYAEVLRQSGLVQKILRDHSIIVAGPTTLSAILSSLRLGFQTLAIQEHSGEIREVLAAVKTECDKFGGIMDKLQKQLNTASKTVESTGARTRAMARHLSDVEQLPQEVASEKLGLLDTQ